MTTEMLEEFAQLGVATIYEASGRTGLIDLPLHQITPSARVAGVARTVLCAQDDNLMVHAVMEVVQVGEILVLAMPKAAPVALVGELLATQAKVRGVSGMLIDAAVRDAEELRDLGVPIWARFIRARGATRQNLGRLNASLEMGGSTIRTGDIVVMDTDGAVVVAQERSQTVLGASRARLAKEADLRQKFQSGILSVDLYGLRQQLGTTLTD